MTKCEKLCETNTSAISSPVLFAVITTSMFSINKQNIVISCLKLSFRHVLQHFEYLFSQGHVRSCCVLQAFVVILFDILERCCWIEFYCVILYNNDLSQKGSRWLVFLGVNNFSFTAMTCGSRNCILSQ